MHIITENGIIETISKMKNLRLDSINTKTQIQRILGIINW